MRALVTTLLTAFFLLSAVPATAQDTPDVMEEMSESGFQGLSFVTLWVTDTDDAIDFWTNKVGFELRGDMPYEIEGVEMRWTWVGIPGQDSINIVLHEPIDPAIADEADHIAVPGESDQLWIFAVDDCAALTDRLDANGVEIIKPCEDLPWGTQAVFADPEGNHFIITSYSM